MWLMTEAGVRNLLTSPATGHRTFSVGERRESGEDPGSRFLLGVNLFKLAGNEERGEPQGAQRNTGKEHGGNLNGKHNSAHVKMPGILANPGHIFVIAKSVP